MDEERLMVENYKERFLMRIMISTHSNDSDTSNNEENENEKSERNINFTAWKDIERNKKKG